ncbi:hypothetical protein [Streptomyces sp. NPDC126514]|uniref:DUF6042 family protein n=1 Tax=Streptomyces sp. NPDC126514 TaxID=3155210 RepID=UPI00333233CE
MFAAAGFPVPAIVRDLSELYLTWGLVSREETPDGTRWSMPPCCRMGGRRDRHHARAAAWPPVGSREARRALSQGCNDRAREGPPPGSKRSHSHHHAPQTSHSDRDQPRLPAGAMQPAKASALPWGSTSCSCIYLRDALLGHAGIIWPRSPQETAFPHKLRGQC